MRRRHRVEDEVEINITPMLDVVFILLIFFIVTTSFVKEKGIDVARPQKSDNPPKVDEKGPIVVKIDAFSNISIKGRIIELNAVRANLEREHAEKPKSPMIIAAHPDAETQALVMILDSANIVGINSISVATQKRK